MKRIRNARCAAVAAAALMVAPVFAHADTQKDLQVAVRALTFLEKAPTGTVVMGVVFDPSKPASVAEKNTVMSTIGGGYSAGGLTVTAKAVEAGAVGSVSGVSVLFVTGGVAYGAVGAAAKGKNLITIGSDTACATSGGCAISVSADPKVEIVVNRAVASAVGATFKAAFRMMIREI